MTTQWLSEQLASLITWVCDTTPPIWSSLGHLRQGAVGNLEPSAPSSLSSPPLHFSLPLIKVFLILILIWKQVSATDNKNEVLLLLSPPFPPGNVSGRQELGGIPTPDSGVDVTEGNCGEGSGSAGLGRQVNKPAG